MSNKCMPIELYIELAGQYNRKIREYLKLLDVETDDVEWKKSLEQRISTYSKWGEALEQSEICKDE